MKEYTDAPKTEDVVNPEYDALEKEADDGFYRLMGYDNGENVSDAPETKRNGDVDYDTLEKEADDKFYRLMGYYDSENVEARNPADRHYANEAGEKDVKEGEEQKADTDKPEEQKNPRHEKIDGKDYYYDDNGKLYRVGNELEPNTEYEINGYKYTTDDKGRIISAEGKLHMKNHEGKLEIKDSLEDIGKGDQKEGDDRGHLIGDQFDGSPYLDNMIPQNADVNEKDFRKFENDLAKDVKDGKDVTVKVEPIYEGDSRRPSAVVVNYSIDGEKSVRVFPND
jgi:hypothetical protein